MIQIAEKNACNVCAEFYFERKPDADKQPGHSLTQALDIFRGEALSRVWMPGQQEGMKLYVGMGEPDALDNLRIKEICAVAAREMKEKKITAFSADVSVILESSGTESIRDIVEGLVLGGYEQKRFIKEELWQAEMKLCGIAEQDIEEVQCLIDEMLAVTEGIWFARDMVNMPGNRLRPEDFAGRIKELVSGTGIEAELLDYAALKERKMSALLGVGASSEYPPCMLALRYRNAPKSSKITGLVGKGVTCDTGGYCLKPAGAMLGIKGDMAGGAAVAGAMYALAKNRVETNVAAVIPMCENRISPGSLLPGDVIDSYAGKTIEICNTDAEGRLILADAVAYAVKEEQVTQVLDIATLTGAVVNMLGFTIGGAVSDDDRLFSSFREAYRISGERYWRLPACLEHEKMIESKLADIKNVGESCCGTITAGLFIKAFAEGRPWLHLDIAGTAWVDKPVFAFQSAGATGAGVTSIYQLCCREGE